MVSNEEKRQVWQAYRDRKPTRVPVTLGVNPRVVVLDERFNPAGVTFQEYFRDAAVAVDIQIKFAHYIADYLSPHWDQPSGLPEDLNFYVDVQNIYDAAYFGCPVHFRDGQVPDITAILEGSRKNDIFAFDLDHPLDNPFIQDCLRRHEGLTREAAKVSIPGVKAGVRPFIPGWDGPLTIATQLRGHELFMDLIEDPAYVVKLMNFLQKAAEIRNRALAQRSGKKVFDTPGGFLADDSIQLISLAMYKELVLPLHRQWYALYGPGPHSIHLCGDATRHFPTLHEELNVCSFDTGFPVDHGPLRDALGEDVEIFGGPEVGLLVTGPAEAVYQRTKQILLSGVKRGGRFVLREGNNLPPKVSEANLAAMYRACLDHGGY